MTFQRELIDWFTAHQRPLPWRRKYRPYEVWVSEIMLQQTRMETVLPYFERWMKAFPDLNSLAASPEERVLKAWEGLGYYSRARNLHATAKRVVAEHGGEFPDDPQAIRALPGIGPYTAGAIASIAFNQNRPIVDGNVMRVLSRLYTIEEPIDTAAGRETFWKLQEKLIPPGEARNFNQALMEFGALVCKPLNPDCPACPIRRHCRAFAEGEPDAYPVRGARKQTVKVTAAALLLESGGAFFLRKRPLGAIMGGLWEFPEWKLARDEKVSPASLLKKATREATSEFGRLPKLKFIETVKRSYTHHQETLHVFRASLAFRPHPKTDWPHTWTQPSDFKKFPFSSAHAKVAKLA